MKAIRRNLSIAALGILFATAVLASPAFAWHLKGCDGVTSEGVCTFVTTVHPSTTVVIGTTVTDSATLVGCDGTHACGSASGSITGSVAFKLYSNDGCTGTPIATSTVAGPFTNPSTVTSGGFSTTSLSAGSYSIKATFTGTGSWSSASKTAGCEPFLLTKAPPTVPEFPLGVALLFGLALPALFLVRTKFATSSVKLP
jgi:hypothetical protein